MPAGNTSGSEYNYKDLHLPVNTVYVYYRLRQEDLDGHKSYSPIRRVKLDPDNQWMVYPNPAQTTCVLSFPAAPFLSAAVSLRDLNGRQLWGLADWQPATDLSIDVQNIPAGVYLLRVQTESNSYSRRILVE